MYQVPFFLPEQLTLFRVEFYAGPSEALKQILRVVKLFLERLTTTLFTYAGCVSEAPQNGVHWSFGRCRNVAVTKEHKNEMPQTVSGGELCFLFVVGDHLPATTIKFRVENHLLRRAYPG